jgi:hypothetical protein
MQVITRKEAIAQGLSRYFTGLPCKHGHVATRRASTGYCDECFQIKYEANRQDKEYLRKERERDRRWKRANKDIINTRRRVRDKEWYLQPPPSPRQIAKSAGENFYFTGKPCPNGHIDYRKVSCGSCVTCKKEYVKTNDRRAANTESARRYRKNNPEAERAKSRRWAEKNKPLLLAKAARRRCAQVNATPSWADHDKILTKYKERDAMQKLTGLQYDVDHYYPIQSDFICGLHISENLRVILSRDNKRKSNKMPENFYGRIAA